MVSSVTRAPSSKTDMIASLWPLFRWSQEAGVPDLGGSSTLSQYAG